MCGHHRDLHVLTHSFPTRRSSDLLHRALRHRQHPQAHRRGAGELIPFVSPVTPDQFRGPTRRIRHNSLIFRIIDGGDCKNITGTISWPARLGITTHAAPCNRPSPPFLRAPPSTRRRRPYRAHGRTLDRKSTRLNSSH